MVMSFRALDSGETVVGVFLDPKKAFDTVDHGIRLKICWR